MSRRSQTIPPEYFEELYIKHGDPWNFASSSYEQKKYAETLAALPQAHFSRALEIGCSIGVLTQQLAARCGRLLAIDAAATPLAQAKRRCADQKHVEFAQMFVPREWPKGSFNLILLSEIVYYLTSTDVIDLAAKSVSSLAPRGAIVLVHWTGETNYPMHGDEAVELFIDCLSEFAAVVRCDKRLEYRLDVLTRR